MKQQSRMTKQLLGLIGYPLSHSFSKEYFRSKFEREGISGYDYELFPLEKITDLPALLEQYPALCGLNVTIPHKVNVLPYLQQLDETAAAIGAVNTIKIGRSGRAAALQRGSAGEQAEAAALQGDSTGLPAGGVVLSGFNTDAYGFQTSLEPLLRPWHKKALILGTGGASRAVLYVLQTLGITPLFVSRRPAEERTGSDQEAAQPGQMTRQAGHNQRAEQIVYEQIDAGVIQEHPLIINTTPLGTFPDTGSCPAIPYDALSERNLLYDLVYNPPETLFLKKGKEKGAATMNGLDMLRLQAEKSWEIWTN